VPGGNTTGTFDIDGISPGSATITAQAGNVTLSAILTVRVQKTIGKPESKEGQGKEGLRKEAGIEKRAPIETVVTGTKTIKVTDALPSSQVGSAPLNLDGSVSTGQGAQAFILAEERPPVGEAVLNASAQPQAKLEVNLEAARADGGSLPSSAGSKGKRVVSRVALKRRAKSIEKPVVAEKGTIAEDVGKRPV